MRSVRTMSTVLALAALVVACGDDGSSGSTSAVTSEVTTTQAVTTTEATPTTEPTPTTDVVTTDTVPVAMAPAVWPAADVVFATPEEAATDFVTNALGVPAVLGEFMAGDSQSGEIEVFLETEGGATSTASARSVLLMRQLGPDNGWFVIAAINEFATVTTPESGSTLAAGTMTVEGVARGFEATVVVEAFVAGSTDLLDQQIVMAGNFDQALPYSVDLDLSAAQSGDVVVILVRGTVGLETDPGDFSAIPVIVS